MKSSGTYMVLEATIMSKVTQTQRTQVVAWSESLYMCVSFGMPMEVKKLIRSHGGRGVSKEGRQNAVV